MELDSFWGLLTERLGVSWQYLHNMSGAAITGAFVLAAMGAFFLPLGQATSVLHASASSVGVVGALIFCALQIFPTGDRAGEQRRRAPARRVRGDGGPVRDRGRRAARDHRQPEHGHAQARVDRSRCRSSCSFLTYAPLGRDDRRASNDIPVDEWPDSVPLVYYAYHIMVGLGTILLADRALLGVILLWRGRLFTSRPMLWALMLAFPFPYIANIAGWVTAETRPPAVDRLRACCERRTPPRPRNPSPPEQACSPLLGFAGLYLLVGIVFLMLIVRIVNQGPEATQLPTTSTQAAAGAGEA